ncbi:MAG: hypothetical protein IKU26_02830 [Clostridia bacterium]|nr:hypothetical protein [Clostridia bacterium]
MIGKMMEFEKNRVMTEKRRIEQELEILPKGKLCLVRNRSWTKWFYYHNGERHYIPKRNRRLAEQLARRKYLTERLEQCNGQLEAIEAYFTRIATSGTENKLLHNKDYQELLAPYFQPQNQELAHWAEAPYERNPYRIENCIHMVHVGLWVRSKSESMIASYLYQHKIPFRYECALKLGKKTIYPDFTLRHPKTGEYYYLEHFGLFENGEYRRHALSKVEDYALNGIYLDQHLIVTTETTKNPFSVTQLIPQLQATAFI